MVSRLQRGLLRLTFLASLCVAGTELWFAPRQAEVVVQTERDGSPTRQITLDLSLGRHAWKQGPSPRRVAERFVDRSLPRALPGEVRQIHVGPVQVDTWTLLRDLFLLFAATCGVFVVLARRRSASPTILGADARPVLGEGMADDRIGARESASTSFSSRRDR